MVRTTLDNKELNRRADEVFVLEHGDHVFDLYTENGEVFVDMQEESSADGSPVNFTYKPNMKERPQALAYLLGERDDFND